MNITIRFLINFQSENVHFTILSVTIAPCIEARSKIGKSLGPDLDNKIKTIEV